MLGELHKQVVFFQQKSAHGLDTLLYEVAALSARECWGCLPANTTAYTKAKACLICYGG